MVIVSFLVAVFPSINSGCLVEMASVGEVVAHTMEVDVGNAFSDESGSLPTCFKLRDGVVVVAVVALIMMVVFG